jgi:hypothetical protein
MLNQIKKNLFIPGELEKASEEMEGPWLKWHRSLKRDREGGRDEVTCLSFLIYVYCLMCVL